MSLAPQQFTRGEPHSNSPYARPAYRYLQVYAFDPSLATNLDTAVMNHVTIRVPWEVAPAQHLSEEGVSVPEFTDLDGNLILPGHDLLQPGPVGDYLEVIDYDPASNAFYAPVDLNDPYLLAQNGLAPSEGTPQFHQQMVYAIAMTTIKNFEKALGRAILWSERHIDDLPAGSRALSVPEQADLQFVRRLRIYPHALREANAYYSPRKKALLFGYFPASPSSAGKVLPGGTVFTCLSHDIIAHETTHALLDGLHRRYIEPSNPDMHAFHEAFADIVAMLQHFSFPDVLRHQIARTRGDLASQNLLGQLAQQFGQATGRSGALRSALGHENPLTGVWEQADPDPLELARTHEPHARGSILVAAIFEAFLSIYKSRIADLLRIATNGTGVLPVGELHPDLVNRLAHEAAKSAQHVLTMCIRALDYCPPVDLEFGDFLRALITADFELVPEDTKNYRVAIIEAFRRRGIYPRDTRTLSTESLLWRPPDEMERTYFTGLREFSPLGQRFEDIYRLAANRRQIFMAMKNGSSALNEWIKQQRTKKLKGLRGLDLRSECKFEVHSARPARRITPEGEQVVEMVLEVIQRRPGHCDPKKQDEENVRWREEGSPTQLGWEKGCDFIFRGGCTLIIDPLTEAVRYCIVKDINDDARLERQRAYLTNYEDVSLRAAYFGGTDAAPQSEPFAFLHRSFVDSLPL